MKFKKFLNNQTGAISIYVSMAIMAILVLMALSFAQIASTGHTETVEEQLNTQALYAAETGIDDARQRLLNLIDAFNRGVRDFNFIDKELNPQGSLGSLNPLANSEQFGDPIVTDGRKILVGSPNTGKVRFFERESGLWHYRSTLTGTTSSGYSKAMALRTNCLFVGAPDGNSVHIYQYDGTNWALSTTSPNPLIGTGGFGSSIVVNNNFLAVTSPTDNSGDGAVYIYEYSKADCTISSTPRVALTKSGSQEFGSSIAINKNDFLVVGAPAAPDASSNLVGAVYTYKYDSNTSTWTDLTTPEYGHNSKNESEFGVSVALNNNNFLTVGVNHSENSSSTDVGAVYVYEYDGDQDEWDKIFTKLGASASDFDGLSLAINNRFLAIGNPNRNTEDGIVYVHEYRGSSDWDTEVFPQQSGSGGERYGAFVVLDDSSSLVVGAPNNGANNKGDVYVISILSQAFSSRDLSDFLQTECENPHPTDPTQDKYNFDLGEGVSYSCLSINLHPDLLYFDKVYNYRSLNVLLKTVNRDNTNIYENMERLEIEWVNSEKLGAGAAVFDTSSLYPFFPAYDDWAIGAPVLRIQVMALDLSDTFDRTTLNNPDHTKVFYLYPSTDPSATGEIDWQNDLDKDGEIIKADCDPVEEICKVALHNLIYHIGTDTVSGPDPPDEMAFFVRVSSLYQTANVSMKGYNHEAPLPGDRVKFKDVQTIIGATGHANYVRLRLEERIRLQPVYDHPEYSIHSATNLCKVLVGDRDTGTNFEQKLIDLPPGVFSPTTLDCAVY